MSLEKPTRKSGLFVFGLLSDGAVGPCPPVHRPDSVIRGLVAFDSGVAYFPTGYRPRIHQRDDWNSANAAPCGSARTEKRPAPSISEGGTHTLAPSDFALSVEASQFDVRK